jgi:DNA double-strand break repair helicase HerA and related ATPase
VDKAFEQQMRDGYALQEPAATFGFPLHDKETLQGVPVQVALSMLNRHGLVAGATGTGKTKTLQVLAGQLSDAGIPLFIADVKGDLTGLGAAGNAEDPKAQARCEQLGWTYTPKAHPIELLSLSGKLGTPVRATVHSFGPLLLAKVMDLNQTQTAVLSLVFKYCDDNQLPLLDLADLRTTLQYLGSDDGKPVIAQYGGMSTATIGVIMRTIITLEQQGAAAFFGEPELDVDDLLRVNQDGTGVITLLELSDVMDKPALFSTFMLWILAQLYQSLPEVGDAPKPKLAFFFDEAHLLFDDASEALLDQVELVARLIRSKGVGLYLDTQSPNDVAPKVLAQLGNRVQHALRAFTAEDADAIRKASRTFPMTDHYDVERDLTALGIGEAFVTVLSPRGVPTPLAWTVIIPPDSLMAALDAASLQRIIAAGALTAKYGQAVDRQSAHEIITARIQAAQAAAGQAPPGGAPGRGRGQPGGRRPSGGRKGTRTARPAPRQPKGGVDVGDVVKAGTKFATSRQGQALIRSVLGTLFKNK